MPDCFVVFYDRRVHVVLTNFFGQKLSPLPADVLDWYAKRYAFERDKLDGCYVQSIDVSQMKYEEFAA